jgi:4'-phosphopantetheinyl transferase
LSAVGDFEALDRWAQSLPPLFRDRLARFHRNEDRYRGALGKWLLSCQLEDIGLPASSIQKLAIGATGRPFLNGVKGIDFNLSHSGDVVVCAVAVGGRVGVDIEAIRAIDCTGPQRVLPEGMPRDGCKHAQEDDVFFRCWTRFESVIKAEGFGLGGPISELKFEETSACFGERRWFLHETLLAAGYCCHVASNLPDVTPNDLRENQWKG